MNAKKLTLLSVALLSFTASSFGAANVNQLSEESSWDDILATSNIEVKGTWMRVGTTNTSVFFVEESNGTLFTKKETRDGYWEHVQTGGDNDRTHFVETGESIKSGPVTIPLAQYERKRINSDKDDHIKVGYKDHEQPLTRKLDVYAVKETGRDDNRYSRYLFSKEYTVSKKQ